MAQWVRALAKLACRYIFQDIPGTHHLLRGRAETRWSLGLFGHHLMLRFCKRFCLNKIKIDIKGDIMSYPSGTFARM